MELSLIPVIEFEPASYATQKRPLPDGDAATDWDVYWRVSLSDAGLSLEPLTTGSWLVAVDQLVQPNVLDILLRNMLEDEDGKNETRVPTAFCGGYALSTPGGLLQPGCCGDLSNLSGWRTASKHTSSDWSMLWIGHPWTHVAAAGDRLLILKPSDDDPPKDLSPFCTLSRQALQEAVNRAADIALTFRERLRPRLTALYPEAPVEEFLTTLTGVPRPD